MKKTLTRKLRVDQEMASEYRFDYSKAKPNRFAEKMKLAMGWTVERFVELSPQEKPKKKLAKAPSARASASKDGNRAPAKKATKAKAPAKKPKSLAKKPKTTKKPAAKKTSKPAAKTSSSQRKKKK